MINLILTALDKTLTEHKAKQLLTINNKRAFAKLIDELINTTSNYNIPEHKQTHGRRIPHELKDRINKCKFSTILNSEMLIRNEKSTYITADFSEQFNVYEGGFPYSYTASKFLKTLLENISKIKNTKIDLKPKFKTYQEFQASGKTNFIKIPKAHFTKVIQNNIKTMFNKQGNNSVKVILDNILYVSNKTVFIDNSPKHRSTDIKGREYTTISSISKELRNKLLSKTVRYEYDINSSLLTIMLNLRCSLKSLPTNGKFTKEFYNNKLKDFKVLSQYVTNKDVFLTKLGICLNITKKEAKTVITALLNDPNYDLFKNKYNAHLNKPANQEFIRTLIKDVNCLHNETFKLILSLDKDKVNYNMEVLGVKLRTMVELAGSELNLQKNTKVKNFGKGKRLYPKQVHYLYTLLEAKIRKTMQVILKSNIQIHDCVFSYESIDTKVLSDAINQRTTWVITFSQGSISDSEELISVLYNTVMNAKNCIISNTIKSIGKIFGIDHLDIRYQYDPGLFKLDIIDILKSKLN